MIFPFLFPYLQGILSFSRAPVTWALVIINMTIYFWFQNDQLQSKLLLKEFSQESAFLSTQGLVFAQFINNNGEIYSPFLKQMATAALDSGQGEKLERLGAIAFRDIHFVRSGLEGQYVGDGVLIDRWRSGFQKYIAFFDTDMNFRFGLSRSRPGLSNWFSYQFLHGSFWHVTTNMLFLLLYGAAIETTIGSAVLLLVYLGSGLIAAATFLWLSGFSATPLIGASGAVSGIVGVFAAMNWNRGVRFFYMLLPHNSYMGFVFLPAWVTCALWIVTDLAGYLATVTEIGETVAHTAHLGGMWAGLLMGLLFFRWSKSSSQSVFGNHTRLNELK